MVSDLSRNPKSLVREGPISIVVRGHTTIECYIYVFTQVLVIAEMIGDGKFYYNHYSLSGNHNCPSSRFSLSCRRSFSFSSLLTLLVSVILSVNSRNLYYRSGNNRGASDALPPTRIYPYHQIWATSITYRHDEERNTQLRVRYRPTHQIEPEKRNCSVNVIVILKN